ncbi:DHA2 family efflux MFS transporter permease subunit [Pseudonocardia sp. GCM10023141]|uniref:DHA2 family efflux MFS transporter permease subunit n=1 Tax=Pseudonocardia sp. GCM10023141 TaxID=3252653 RepID=UPI003615ABC6
MTETPTARLDPAVLRLAGILVLGVLAPLLDSTIVNIAIHTLAVELDTTVSVIQWVSTAYLLGLAAAIPITGWAVERFGAKRMWIAALLLFLVGSALCGMAWDVGSLIAFRAVQGVGGGLMLPILQTLLLRAAGGRQLGKLMSVVTLPVLVGPILGPVIGGLIVGNLSWRWIFYVNLPLGIAAVALAWWALPADSRGRVQRLDLVGLLLLSPSFAALLYGLSQVGVQGRFDAPEVLVPVLVGALLLVTFVVRAVRVPGPLIDLTLFGNRSFAASSALLFLSGLSLFGPMLLLPIYYQDARGLGVIAAALMLVPQGLGSLLARMAGTLTDRIGPRPVVLGAIALSTLGTVPFALGTADTSYWLLGAGLVLRGIGLSAANLAVMVGAYRGLDREQIPHASSTTRIMQQIGASLGTAVLAVILQRELLAQPVVAVAFGHAFWWAVAFAALAVVPALLLPRQPDDRLAA